MYEVAERFYIELVAQFREVVEEAEHEGKTEAAAKAMAVLDEILARPEHGWFTGQEPDAVKKARLKAQSEFKQRYLQEAAGK
jgi:hypothetical protein